MTVPIDPLALMTFPPSGYKLFLPKSSTCLFKYSLLMGETSNSTSVRNFVSMVVFAHLC